MSIPGTYIVRFNLILANRIPTKFCSGRSEKLAGKSAPMAANTSAASQHGPARPPFLGVEDESDDKGNEPGDEGACLTLIVYLEIPH